MKIFAAFLMLSSSFAIADVLKCGGSEPFWSLEVSGREIKMTDFSGPNGQEIFTYPSVREKSAFGFESDTVRVYNSINQVNSAIVSVTVIKGECGANVGEEFLPYSVVFQDGPTIFYGCCSY